MSLQFFFIERKQCRDERRAQALSPRRFDDAPIWSAATLMLPFPGPKLIYRKSMTPPPSLTNSAEPLTVDLRRALIVAAAAATRAGELIVRARREQSFEVKNKKSDVDLVTSADVAAEKIIVEAIKAEFPDHTILAEESAPQLAAADYQKPLWVIDPIDGTTNFVHGHYQVGVSIAFALSGTVELGVVHAPFLGETFTAQRGHGAFLNGAPIRVSTTSSLKRALIGTGFPYTREDIPLFVRQLTTVLEACRDIRRLGSAALDICMVAAGRIEAFYETVNPWDIAAGCLIAREAGATTGHIHPRSTAQSIPPDLDGFELVVAAPTLFADFQRLLQSVTPQREPPP